MCFPVYHGSRHTCECCAGLFFSLHADTPLQGEKIWSKRKRINSLQSITMQSRSIFMVLSLSHHIVLRVYGITLLVVKFWHYVRANVY